MLKSNAIVLVAAVVGIACGLVSLTRLLAGQWINLIVWGLAGVVLGWYTSGRRLILWAGIVFGVCLTLSFLLAGFQGSPDKLPGFLLLTLGLSVVGAVAGVATVFVGARLRRLVR